MISNHIDLSNSPFSIMLIVLFFIIYASRTGHLQQYFQEYFSSSVRVNEDNELFVLISNNISTQLSSSDSIRHLIARFKAEDPFENLGSPDSSKRAISYTPICYCSFKYKKYVFRATFQAEITGDTKLKYIRIWNYNGIEPLKDYLDFLSQGKHALRSSCTFFYRPWSNCRFVSNPWKFSGLKQIRPMDSVILDEEVKQSLIHRVKSFEENRQLYLQSGTPYRLGLLLYGSPGSGKTSMASALAGYFARDVYVMGNLSNMDDDELQILFAGLPDRAIVLFEDIDAAGLGDRSNPSSEDTKRRGTTLAAMLEATDGISSPENIIVIMSTNRKEVLDEALLRPGRIDMKVHFRFPTHEQAKDLFLRVYDTKDHVGLDLESLSQEFAEKIPNPPTFSAAALKGHLIKHLRDPQKAVTTTESWIERERHTTA